MPRARRRRRRLMEPVVKGRSPRDEPISLRRLHLLGKLRRSLTGPKRLSLKSIMRDEFPMVTISRHFQLSFHPYIPDVEWCLRRMSEDGRVRRLSKRLYSISWVPDHHQAVAHKMSPDPREPDKAAFVCPSCLMPVRRHARSRLHSKQKCNRALIRHVMEL